MIIDNLIIELTRRCNMACEHCLRGEPENLDVDPEDINTLFSKVDSIYTLTLSGGEPSLVPELIEKVIEMAEKNDVDILNFYIATNGKKITLDFILAVVKLYAYCSENDYSALDYSNDKYHDNLSSESLKLLSSLKFFNKKFPEDNYNKSSILKQGRASNSGTRAVEGEEITKEDETIYGALYLNCEGKIVAGCDWSFEDQDYNVICEVDEFSLELVEEMYV